MSNSPEKKIILKTPKSTNSFLAIYVYLALHFKNIKFKLKAGLLKLKAYLEQEKGDTKIMLDIYLRYNQGKASKVELKQANKQFREILKGLGLGFLLILPFSPITLPVIIKLADKLGIQILPDFFTVEKK